MLIEEIKGDRVLHYSDAGYYILQIETNIKYESADDVYPCKYTYKETDEKIPTPEPQPEPEEIE